MIGAQIPTVADLDPRLSQMESMLAQILTEVSSSEPPTPNAMRRVIIAATTGCVRR